MRTVFIKTFLITTLFAFLFSTCRKDTLVSEVNQPQTQQDDYSSMNDFFAKNGVPLQTYTVSAANGGSFTTPQGTLVTIAGGIFVTQSFLPVDTGTIKIEFKDIYKRSDMLLSNTPTTYTDYTPLKSGGEFFIRASQNGMFLLLVPFSNGITVIQPLGGFAADPNMMPFVRTDTPEVDSLNFAWEQTSDTLQYNVVSNASDYIFSLYQFSTPTDSGTWCNSDNQSYFNSYPQTSLILNPTDNPDTFQTNVFLVFQNIDCMVHVYKGGSYYHYPYAPKGLQCTIVAVGEKGGKLFSSFTPLSIDSNQTVNFTLSATTTAAFKTALKALD